MLHSQIPLINKTIKRTGKAVVSIGCSFVQGQGAIDDDLYDNYTWKYQGMGYPIRIDITNAQKFEILKKHPGIIRPDPDHVLDFTLMEYKNAFVNVLCEKYFDGEYAPINLGIRGCGNRASIKELYFRPEINWDDIKELVVVYMPSGIERFDFVNDLWPEHFHWKAMWPNIKYFEHELSVSIERDMDGNVKTIAPPGFFTYDNSKEHKRLANLWPWEKMFKPEGFQTLADLAMSKEPSLESTNDFFFQFLGNRTPNGWMTPCAHPGVKAHDLYAKLLYNHIKTL